MKAPMNETPLSQADEVEALLPWLVTGKLDEAETARVQRYLDANPQVAAHVGLARDEFDATITVNEAIKGPKPGALDRLMADIAATPQPRTFTVPSPLSVWERIAGFLNSFTPTTLGLVGAAAALLLVLQAVTIGSLLSRDGAGGPAYQTASGPSAGTGAGIEAHVLLQPGVSASALTAALRDLKGSIVSGPTAEGYYRLRLAAEAGGPDAALSKAKARSDVFALVAKAGR